MRLKPDALDLDLATSLLLINLDEMAKKMNGVFVAVRDALVFIGKVTNRTYVEINIFVYFILIPCVGWGSWT